MTLTTFHRVVSACFPVSRSGHQDIAKPSSRFVATAVDGLSTRETTAYLEQFAYRRYGFLGVDDFLTVPRGWEPPPASGAKRISWTARLRNWIHSKVRGDAVRRGARAFADGDADDDNAMGASDGGDGAGTTRPATKQVGTVGIAVVARLRRYVNDSIDALVAAGHLHVPRDGVLEAFAHVDSKSTGLLGCRAGGLSPILLHFAQATSPGEHVAWLPLGVVVGKLGSAAALEHAMCTPLRPVKGRCSAHGRTLASYLNSLDGLVLSDRLRLRVRLLGDYDTLRSFRRATRSGIPFPSAGSTYAKRGLAAEWFTSTPCVGCARSANEMYESLPEPAGALPVHEPFVRLQPVYGRMHMMNHVVAGFMADLTRVIYRLRPAEPLLERLVDMFRSHTVPSTFTTYDPLWRGQGRNYSKHKTEPVLIDANMSDPAAWGRLCDEVSNFFAKPKVRQKLEKAGLPADALVAGMRSLTDYYHLLHADLVKDNFKLRDALRQACRTIDEAWLRMVRCLAPANAGTVGPTYCPMITGRGISSHYGLAHVVEQQVALGSLAPVVSEKGGENMNSFAAEVWNAFRLSRTSIRRMRPALCLRALIIVFRARCLHGSVPNMAHNACYDARAPRAGRKKGPTGPLGTYVRAPWRKRRRGPAAFIF